MSPICQKISQRCSLGSAIVFENYKSRMKHNLIFLRRYVRLRVPFLMPFVTVYGNAEVGQSLEVNFEIQDFGIALAVSEAEKRT